MALLHTLSQVTSNEISSRALLLLFATIAFFWGLPVVYGLLISPTKSVPGPFWALVTKWWEYRAVLKGDSNHLYIRLHQKYGPVVRVGPTRYSFSRPEDVKAIYELGGSLPKSTYYEPLCNSDPNKIGIFALRDQNVHRDRRRKINSLYTMSAMVSYEDAVDKMTRICTRKLRQFADENRLFSLPDFMQLYAFDVIGEITFNQSFDMMENESDVHGMIKGIHAQNDYFAFIGLVPGLHPWIERLNALLGRESKAATVARYAAAQVAKHSEENAKPSKGTKYDTFLKKLLDLEAAHKVSIPNVMDATASNIGGGSDTTGISLSSAFFYLFKNPEKLAKLRQEIDTMASQHRMSDPVTFREAQDMPYLQAVIKETLRVHPGVGTVLARTVPKGGMDLAGVHFPEGSEVGANAWVLHYSKDIYGADAHEFRPERWLEPRGEQTSLRESMWFPFGAGSRTCIGKNISLLELTKAIPQIVRNFDFVFESESKSLNSRCAWFVYPEYRVWVRPRGSTA